MPRKTRQSNKQRVAADLEPEQAEALKALSTRTRIPQQTFIREAIDDLLKKYKQRK